MKDGVLRQVVFGRLRVLKEPGTENGIVRPIE